MNLISVIVVATVLVFGIMKWLDYYTRHGQTVTVPNIENMTLVQGANELHKHGLEAVVSDSIYVKDKTPGIIIDVNPVIGSKVKEGRTVYITINTNKVQEVILPDVIDNRSARLVRADISPSGFI